MPKIQSKQIKLDTNPSLGTSDVIISSQNAIKQYVDNQIAASGTAIFTANIPSNATSPYSISHNLNTFNYFVTAYDDTTKEDVMVDINRVNNNTVEIFFNTNPNGMTVLILASSNVVAAGTNGNANTSSTYATTITGDNSSTVFQINHNMNTYDVIAQVFNNTGNRSNVSVGVDRPSVNYVNILFDTAPTNSESFRVLISKA